SFLLSCDLFSALFFFFFMLRPPPTSPLFPYTTLFRSFPFLGAEYQLKNRLFLDTRYHFNFFKINNAGIMDMKIGFFQIGLGYRLDRKSTRLNSSHVKISYAVFCLKKKNNNKNICHL